MGIESTATITLNTSQARALANYILTHANHTMFNESWSGYNITEELTRAIDDFEFEQEVTVNVEPEERDED